jgi:hypothetical protein
VATAAPPRHEGQGQTQNQRQSRSNSQSLLLLLRYCPACWKCTVGFNWVWRVRGLWG